MEYTVKEYLPTKFTAIIGNDLLEIVCTNPLLEEQISLSDKWQGTVAEFIKLSSNVYEQDPITNKWVDCTPINTTI